jgi:hypothetical protein
MISMRADCGSLQDCDWLITEPVRRDDAEQVVRLQSRELSAKQVFAVVLIYLERIENGASAWLMLNTNNVRRWLIEHGFRRRRHVLNPRI